MLLLKKEKTFQKKTTSLSGIAQIGSAQVDWQFLKVEKLPKFVGRGPAQIDWLIDTIYIVNKLPKLGVGGGVIWAMPKRKGIFLKQAVKLAPGLGKLPFSCEQVATK